MKTSCGIIIINELNEIFVGHSTGNKFYDIPKGMLEAGESPISCAVRECQEETSLVFSEAELTELGLFPYNKEKNLHLFFTKVNKSSIELSSLVCHSMFEHYYTKKLLPEVDSFTWIKFNEVEQHCAKSMGKLLTKIISDNFQNKSSMKP